MISFTQTLVFKDMENLKQELDELEEKYVAEIKQIVSKYIARVSNIKKQTLQRYESKLFADGNNFDNQTLRPIHETQTKNKTKNKTKIQTQTQTKVLMDSNNELLQSSEFTPTHVQRIRQSLNRGQQLFQKHKKFKYPPNGKQCDSTYDDTVVNTHMRPHINGTSDINDDSLLTIPVFPPTHNNNHHNHSNSNSDRNGNNNPFEDENQEQLNEEANMVLHKPWKRVEIAENSNNDYLHDCSQSTSASTMASADDPYACGTHSLSDKMALRQSIAESSSRDSSLSRNSSLSITSFNPFQPKSTSTTKSQAIHQKQLMLNRIKRKRKYQQMFENINAGGVKSIMTQSLDMTKHYSRHGNTHHNNNNNNNNNNRQHGYKNALSMSSKDMRAELRRVRNYKTSRNQQRKRFTRDQLSSVSVSSGASSPESSLLLSGAKSKHFLPKHSQLVKKLTKKIFDSDTDETEDSLDLSLLHDPKTKKRRKLSALHKNWNQNPS